MPLLDILICKYKAREVNREQHKSTFHCYAGVGCVGCAGREQLRTTVLL